MGFYSARTIRTFARLLGYDHVIADRTIQLLSLERSPSLAWRLARLRGTPLFPAIRRLRRSKTESDQALLATRGQTGA